MVPIHVIGIGLEGAAGLIASVRQRVEQATVLVGSTRHLSYFPDHVADRIVLGDLSQAIAQLHQQLKTLPSKASSASIAILTSGDPLFFGLGRLLLLEFPPEQLSFYPHLSSVQLAFSRIKQPWQDARLISAHGRSLEELTQAAQQGLEKIAVLTDGIHTPAAIANLLVSLDLPNRYRLWVCENLGAADERVVQTEAEAFPKRPFAALNVVVLQRVDTASCLDLEALPLLGIPDRHFLSFPDRPGLMTKREVRVQVLGELALQSGQTIWDVGAGTGSVAVEVGRLCPDSQVYAIEKTAIGARLIQQNSQRFQVSNLVVVHGAAPAALDNLPTPDRVFIGGSGGNLTQILDRCAERLAINGRMLLAFATLEHLARTLTWLEQQESQENSEYHWSHRVLNIQIARSTAVADLTRFTPLNPVTLFTLEKQPLC